jgi:hypothetical protein
VAAILYIHNTFKNNLLEKGWAKNQPFKKRLSQKLQPMGGKVQAKQVDILLFYFILLYYNNGQEDYAP